MCALLRGSYCVDGAVWYGGLFPLSIEWLAAPIDNEEAFLVGDGNCSPPHFVHALHLVPSLHRCHPYIPALVHVCPPTLTVHTMVREHPVPTSSPGTHIALAVNWAVPRESPLTNGKVTRAWALRCILFQPHRSVATASRPSSTLSLAITSDGRHAPLPPVI